MRTPLPKILTLLAWVTGGSALAQTPTLEFAAGAGNPTGTGPSVANQVITFQNNTDNPTANTLAAYTPTTTVTFALSNQQYPTNQYMSTNTGVAFGANNSTTVSAAPGLALFPLMNSISGANNVNNLYSSANGLASSGIDVANNNSVEIMTDVMVLPTTVGANQRYQYADLTITFNQPVVNPVLHLTGLGASYTYTNASNVSVTNGFTTELDLLTSGVTLSRLSGSSELAVSSTGGTSNLGQITNPTTNPGAGTGAGAASGSVLVTTGAAGVTTLQFRI